MAKEMTWKKAILKVLQEADGAMHYKEIAEAIVNNEYRSNIGATPAATVSANITTSIKKEGEKSPFRKVGKGEYIVRSSSDSKSHTKEIEDEKKKVEKEEEEQAVICALGMYWQRSRVVWKRDARLFGRQQIGAESVDFGSQVGIYLLHDGREVVYVGRAIDRPMGKRLFEHTVDRLSGRWDRFSWFGLRGVTDRGTLQDLPSNYQFQSIIPALEALLIEALEPRQNRRRGDDFTAIEFIQADDPEQKDLELKNTLKEIESKLR